MNYYLSVDNNKKTLLDENVEIEASTTLILRISHFLN